MTRHLDEPPTKAVILRRPTGTWTATFPCGCIVHGHDFTATYTTVELSCPFHGVEALWEARQSLPVTEGTTR